MGNAGLRDEMETYLRKLWDSDEYISGVLSVARADEDRETILAFIDKAAEEGDEVTADDISLLALYLANRRGKQLD